MPLGNAMNIRDTINRIDDIRAREEFDALCGDDEELSETEISSRRADAEYVDYLKRLEFKGARKYVFDIKVWRRPRSLRQNRLERLWLKCIEDETGNDANDLHSFFKGKFLTPRRVTINGVETTVPASTTTLNTEEFTKYLDQIQQFAMDFLGVQLPQPDGLGWDDLVARYGDQ
jgi:hypothetical protein